MFVIDVGKLKPNIINQRYYRLIVIVGIFIIIGVVYLIASHASSPVPYTSIAASTGTLSGNACKISDPTAINHTSIDFESSACSTVSLPAGVTLVAIDGDKLNSSGTANASPGYYCKSTYGSTIAPTNNYACLDGWDASSFIPIGPYYEAYSDENATDGPTNYAALDWNTIFASENTTDVDAATANGVFSIISADTGSVTATPTSDTVGLESYDEPASWSEAIDGPENVSSTLQDGRFWYVNNTWDQMLYGPVSGTPGDTQADFFSDPITTISGTRYLDIGSDDIYWFSNAQGTYSTISEGCLLYGTSCNLPLSENDCGCRYGDMIRPVFGTTVGLPANEYEASWHSTFPSPMYDYVETGNVGASSDGLTYITPPELNWAVWSLLNHGARAIIYFDHNFSGDSCSSDGYLLDQGGYSESLACSAFVPQAGQSVSIFNQVKSTDAQVESLASEINSPTALSYASVTPAPTTFGGIETRSVFDTNSNDCAGQASCFYIFADTRDALPSYGGPTNISVTYNLAGHYSGNIPVTTQCGNGASVTGTVSDSSNQFNDIFANAACTKVYGPIPNE